ncbi:MAG: hypothetical protein RIA38_00120 [Microcella pacifica]|uniref:Uncharacterized protein n=1 Tax=Microcella pacifica TaxID=2591847 RepID=A0A9E5MF73_9MICO|nr:hypothetical protein [Microcella pacifica]MBR22198.1 hypothetical protein [Leifsonia sp.]MBU1251476.1 hypothetical protein [Actinomycetota bacterium]MBU1609228.1 hypothetical protein [Actinomycetota bacterium]MBU2314803.1 hypothetical protein [Actinomycetota bacterium]MBU2385018.1 hypothetical protein [Actinomycetota bacterium]
MSEHQPDGRTAPNAGAQQRPTPAVPTTAAQTARAGMSQAARRAWMALGLACFLLGVVVTIIAPDNLALGIALLGAGVVLYTVPGMRKPSAAPGPPRSEAPSEDQRR